MYSINFSRGEQNFCLSLNYNGANSYLFVNGTEIIKLLSTPLCLGNISKEWSADNMKNTGLRGMFVILV